MIDHNAIFDSNKKVWNSLTTAHKDAPFFNLHEVKTGTSSLMPFVEEELKHLQIEGKEVLHLQCNFGLDSFSLARLGSKVTANDFSENAIDLANSLNQELHLPVDFLCANTLELDQLLDKKFDFVVVYLGVICWLPDMLQFGKIVSKLLKKGGHLYMCEHHPISLIYNQDFNTIEGSYYGNFPIEEEVVVNEDTGEKVNQVMWNHSLDEVLNSLLMNGLNLEFFHELPFSNHNWFNNMIQRSDGYWRLKALENKIPLLYSLSAVKQ